MREFSELIKAKRMELGLSMDSVCRIALEKTGYKISKSLLNFLEKGQRVPTYEVAYALAIALGLEIEQTIIAAYDARILSNKEKERRFIRKLVDKRSLKGVDPEIIVR